MRRNGFVVGDRVEVAVRPAYYAGRRGVVESAFDYQTRLAEYVGHVCVRLDDGVVIDVGRKSLRLLDAVERLGELNDQCST